ncbi:MAG: HU family DNA-binding protein [Acidimicrobiia bacterium]|nr:HU family DNA-binding protein [Acidimicrobiia bacterium]
MNKSELVEAVSSEAEVDKRSAEKVLGVFFETVQSSTKGGDKVSWPGFGSFRAIQRSARMGRTSPSDPTPKRIAASTAMKFTPSASLKEFMNTKGRAKKAAPKKTAAKKKTTAKKTTAKATKKKTTAKKR